MNRYFLFRVLTALVFVFGLLTISVFLPRHWNAAAGVWPLGSHDFTAYWNAATALIRGENPYLPFTGGRHFHNPPWVLPLIAPFGLLGFDFARIVWFVFQCGLYASCIKFYFIWRGSRPEIWDWFLLLSFPPFLDSLFWGNLGVLAICGICLILYSINSKRAFVGGLCGGFGLFLLTNKPQTSLLLGVYLLYVLIKERRWPLLRAGAGILVAAIGIVVFLQPDIFSFWLGKLPDSLKHAQESSGASLPATLRLVLFKLRAQRWDLLLVLIPALAFILMGIFFLFRKSPPNLSRELPLFLLISFLFAPYAWFHDAVILMPVVVDRLLKDRDNEDNLLLIVCSFSLMWLGMDLHMVRTASYYQQCAWFPLTLGLLFLWRFRARSIT